MFDSSFILTNLSPLTARSLSTLGLKGPRTHLISIRPYTITQDSVLDQEDITHLRPNIGLRGSFSHFMGWFSLMLKLLFIILRLFKSWQHFLCIKYPLSRLWLTNLVPSFRILEFFMLIVSNLLKPCISNNYLPKQNLLMSSSTWTWKQI